MKGHGRDKVPVTGKSGQVVLTHVVWPRVLISHLRTVPYFNPSQALSSPWWKDQGLRVGDLAVCTSLLSGYKEAITKFFWMERNRKF